MIEYPVKCTDCKKVKNLPANQAIARLEGKAKCPDCGSYSKSHIALDCATLDDFSEDDCETA